MSFDWSFFLEVAKELACSEAKGQRRGADFRASIGRSYYAAFGLACAFVRRNGGKIPRMEKHSFVKQWFRIQAQTDCSEVALLLQILLNQRGKADYEERFSDCEIQASICLDYAKDAIGLLRKM